MAISKKLGVLCGLVLTMAVGCGASQKGPSSPAGSNGENASTQATSESAAKSGFDDAPAPMADTASNYPSPASAPPPAAAPVSPMSPSSTASGASAERSAPAPVTQAAPRTAPAPKERPGLGTEWGESRYSHVHDVSFIRSDDDRPFATAALRYNDRAGVEALANYHASHGPRFREVPAAGGAVTVAVHDGSGESLEAVHVADRTYVIGREGERYTIVLTNHTDHRFETVATVDGLDVINGHTGTLANRGYVLMPYATLEIDGFRQSQDAVAAFRFSKVSESYAAQTGKARNVGVIGVAFFSERGDTFPSAYSQEELRTRDTASPFPGQDPRYASPPRR